MTPQVKAKEQTAVEKASERFFGALETKHTAENSILKEGNRFNFQELLCNLNERIKRGE